MTGGPRRGDLVVPMRPRSPDEEHRAATPLELFFDLVVVVAVARAAHELHHAIADLHVAEGLVGYGMVFFAIWWAWINFSWFASAYDTDDVPYRIAVFVQLTGALVMAAGVERGFEERDFGVMTAGYVVMRLALVGQWLRAAAADPARRTTALRYAGGVTACQIGWVALAFGPPTWTLPGFLGLATAELLVPVWAERVGPTSWHPGHIVERYGLFTIIVLGESILAASIAIQSVAGTVGVVARLAPVVGGGIVLVFGLWWLYFEPGPVDLKSSLGTVFAWGYGHLPIFAAAAAVGAGLAVAVDEATGHAAIGPVGAGAAVAIPTAVYLLGLWALHRPGPEGPGRGLLVPAVALLVLATPATGRAVPLTGALVALLLVVKLARRRRAQRAPTSGPTPG